MALWDATTNLSKLTMNSIAFLKQLQQPQVRNSGPELCTKISNYADYRPFKGTHSFMLVKSQNFYLYVNYVGFSHTILFF